MKVFLYERVSSEEQARHGYSLDAQHEALVEFCEKNNHIILGEYKDEGISARKPYTKRPAMVQLLNDLDKVKPDMILFTKLDRWFRNIREYYRVQDILEKHKIYWKAIHEEYDTSTASGRLYVNIKLSIAQDEADRTSERIKDVQSQLIAQGKVLCGSVPLGYAIKDKHVVFSDDIHITKEAIDHYMLHQSALATTRYINEKYGLTMIPRNLLNLFRSPLLKGEYHTNTAFCEPLITPEEWDDLQAVIKKNIKHASKKNTYIFTGLIICPVCGNRMAGCYDHRSKYYRCAKKYYGTCTMPHVVTESRLEKWLLDNIEEDFRIQVEMKPKQKTESPQKYRDRLKRLNDMYLMGNISAEEYRSRSEELQRKIAELQKAPKETPKKFEANWKEVYEKLDDEHKRSFWRHLVKEIRPSIDTKDFEILY